MLDSTYSEVQSRAVIMEMTCCSYLKFKLKVLCEVYGSTSELSGVIRMFDSRL